MMKATTPKRLGVALNGDAYDCFLSLGNRERQEQVRLFYWRPSIGDDRYNAIIDPAIPPPLSGEIIETGNVSFTDSYLGRILAGAPAGSGIGIVHNHFGPGWQALSRDDTRTESEYLAPVVYASRKLPLLGLTIAGDGFLSGRLWEVGRRNKAIKHDIDRIRVVGERFLAFRRPHTTASLKKPSNRIATLSVWGEERQVLLESLRIGIVGLGSVGSMVAESLARMGIRDFVLIDADRLEERNLDRTIGAYRMDVLIHSLKVSIAKRTIRRTATGRNPQIMKLCTKVQDERALRALLDCDFIFSCVDRHLPRYILNYLAYSHLIPVIDGGIHIGLPDSSKPSLDISWRMHLVAPGRPCLECIYGYEYSKVGLERDGLIDDPRYINGAPEIQKEYDARENVFCFSMSCAAHEVIQFLGYALDEIAVSPIFPQMYFAGAGVMFKTPLQAEVKCKQECQVQRFDSQAIDLSKMFR
ncbi:MAG: HesA/MoeB/ThiF family protein [Rectinemataceae bacterium]